MGRRGSMVSGFGGGYSRPRRGGGWELEPTWPGKAAAGRPSLTQRNQSKYHTICRPLVVTQERDRLPGIICGLCECIAESGARPQRRSRAEEEDGCDGTPRTGPVSLARESKLLPTSVIPLRPWRSLVRSNLIRCGQSAFHHCGPPSLPLAQWERTMVLVASSLPTVTHPRFFKRRDWSA